MDKKKAREEERKELERKKKLEVLRLEEEMGKIAERATLFYSRKGKKTRKTHGKCMICKAGLAEPARLLAEKGWTYEQIAEELSKKTGIKFTFRHVANHFHHYPPNPVKRAASKVKKKIEKKSLEKAREEVKSLIDMILDFFAAVFEAAGTISPDEIRKLPLERRIKIVNETLRTYQGQQKVLLAAKRLQLEEEVWKKELFEAMAGSTGMERKKLPPPEKVKFKDGSGI